MAGFANQLRLRLLKQIAQRNICSDDTKIPVMNGDIIGNSIEDLLDITPTYTSNCLLPVHFRSFAPKCDAAKGCFSQNALAMRGHECIICILATVTSEIIAEQKNNKGQQDYIL